MVKQTDLVSIEQGKGVKYKESILFIFILAALVLAAVGITFSNIQRCNDADSLLPIIISTQYWTPFYWGQNRFGMLIPLLALPFQNPLMNLIVQNIISTTLSLVALLFIARFVYGRSFWVTIGAVVACFIVLFYPDYVLHDYFIKLPNGPALGLCFGGLCLLSLNNKKGKPLSYILPVIGILLIILSIWINLSLVSSVLIMVVLQKYLLSTRMSSIANLNTHTLSIQSPKDYGEGLWKPGFSGIIMILAVILAFILNYVFMRFSSFYSAGNYGILPPKEWVLSWTRLLQSSLLYYLPNWNVRFALLTLVSITTTLIVIEGQARSRRFVLYAGCVIGIAMAGDYFISGSNRWVKMNMFHGRYVMTTFLLFHVMLAGTSVFMLANNWSVKTLNRICGVSMGGLFFTIVLRFGFPSYGVMRAALNDISSTYSQEIIENHCTHFAGDYWTVWPAVFHVNMLLYEQHKVGRIWGISYRSESFFPRHIPFNKSFMYIGGAKGDREIEKQLRRFAISFRREKEGRAIIIYRSYSPGKLSDAGYLAKIKFNKIDCSMISNKIDTAWIEITNTGNSVWPSFADDSGNHVVRVSYHWRDYISDSLIVKNGLRTDLPCDMEPGRSEIINMKIKPPSNPGKYLLEVTLVQEGDAWFDEKGCAPLRLPITVDR